jgi:hypothetical protein
MIPGLEKYSGDNISKYKIVKSWRATKVVSQTFEGKLTSTKPQCGAWDRSNLPVASSGA